MEHRFLSTRELGTLLGVTRQTIRNWIKRGEVRAFHIGQSLKIPSEEAVRILTLYGLPVPHGLDHGHMSPLDSVSDASTRMHDASSGGPDSIADQISLDKDCAGPVRDDGFA
jgi:excisionase family DNA binding protein